MGARLNTDVGVEAYVSANVTGTVCVDVDVLANMAAYIGDGVNPPALPRRGALSATSQETFVFLYLITCTPTLHTSSERYIHQVNGTYIK